jgi:hypothetical protein
MSACVNAAAASSIHLIAKAWVFADDFHPHETRAPLQVTNADTTELGRYKCNPLYDRGWSSRAEAVSVTSTAEEYMVCPPLQTPHLVVPRAQ